MLQEAHKGDAVRAGVQTRPQSRKMEDMHRCIHWCRPRSCHKEVVGAGADEGPQEEDTPKLGRLQYHNRKPPTTMLRLPRLEAVEVDERGAEDRDSAHAWLLVDANSAGS